MALNADAFKDTLSSLPKGEQQQLLSQLCAEDFNGQLADSNSPAIELASTLLPLAATFSIAPISGFHVGAVAVGASGALYLGANLEFADAPLCATLHAEQSAVLNAFMHGETSLKALAISEAPCGYCRQFLWELPEANKLPIIVGDMRTNLEQLLPMPFGEPRQSSHGLLDSSPTALQSITPITDEGAQRAMDAAQHSYTPYTCSPEGFAIECANGKHFAGRAAENIAFNPSVPAVLGALNQRNLSSSRDQPIVRCTQAGLDTSQHSNSELAASILRSLSNVKIQTIILKAQK